MFPRLLMPNKPRLAASRILPRYQAEPCCEVSALAKRSAVAYCGDDGRSNNRADAWDLPYAAAPRIVGSDPG
jgi:hypothetical protein